MGNASVGDRLPLDEGLLPLPSGATGGVGPVPNAARSWADVSEPIPSTYWRSLGVSDRSTVAWVGVLDRAELAPECATWVAIAHTASASTATVAAIAATACDRGRAAVFATEL